MPPQRGHQTLFSKLLSTAVERFGDAVSVQGKHVSGAQPALRSQAFPILEETQHRAGGVESLKSVVAVEKQRGEVSTVGVAQALRLVVVLAEEEAGIGVVGGILIKELVHRLKKAQRAGPRPGIMSGQVG